jgi:DNA ligase-4
VTVEEIDRVMQKIASSCHFSSPSVQASRVSPSIDKEHELRELYRRVSPRDGKWLTRLILKNYEPVVLEPNTVYRGLHTLLPTILKVQEDFAVAGRFLQEHVRQKGVTGADLSRDDLALRLRPKLGVKVGRQPWHKGRSIKHSLDMSHGRMSCEDKLDGEYCQIHIDLSKGYNCIQIFSKSGKDSTRDRSKLHDAIRNSLHLGQRSCPLKTGCILEGELLVYSDKEKKVLGFEKIRKHVSRSGAFLGTEQDSQPHSYEHLMIVYFDILMVDSESLLGVRHSQRRKILEGLIHCREGQSQLVRRHIIDCDKRSAASDLRRIFARCITDRAEGLVLKSDDPYFDFSTRRRPYSSSCIKLKKEYIGGFGDVGDFAVVGARYDAAKAKSYDLPNLKWTHFYIGCLDNKNEVVRWGRQPVFVVTNVVELNATQMESFITHANPPYVAEPGNESTVIKIAPGIDMGKRPSAIFTDPPVFDIRCFSFHKEGNTGFWSPRFAMVNKIHSDRSYVDVLSFTDLQKAARMEKEMPPPSDSQELMGWIAALEQADPKGTTVERTSQTTTITTVSTVRTELTPSPVQPSKAREWDNMPPFPESPLSAMRRAKTTQITAGELPTPPTSSALEPPIQDAPVVSRVRVIESSQKRKCELGTAPRQPKARKQRAGESPPTSSLVRASSNSQRTPRGALADITSSSQSRDNAGVLPQLPNRRITGIHSFREPSIPPQSSSGLSSASFQTALEQCRPSIVVEVSDSTNCNIRTSSRFHLSQADDTPRPSLRHEMSVINLANSTASTSSTTQELSCIFSGSACPLRHVSFLLAPCIANMPWLTEDLFSKHGISTTDFIITPDGWTHLGPLSGITTPGGCTSTVGCSGRRKKIVLVERRRKDATAALLQEVGALQLRRRNGGREYVPVFDWRVIEALTDEEAGHTCLPGKVEARFDIRSAASVWKKYWVGLA